MAVRRWIRRHWRVGQGWSLEIGECCVLKRRCQRRTYLLKGWERLLWLTGSSILAWKKPLDRGAWRAIVIRVAKSDMTDWAERGNLLLGWNGGGIFLKKYCLGKLKWPWSFLGTEYQGSWYRGKEKAWVFSYKMAFLLLVTSIFPPLGLAVHEDF